MNIAELQPQELWKNFAALNAVPRPSKKEERVIAFIKNFGEDLGLDTTVDETGNVIIRKPATEGMENRKPIVMQSHLDMVCQKNNDTDFDFDTQGIKMLVDGDWVKADGTTLGADNGIGVAAIMAVLESKDIAHPALEALFTIDEETGMTGALGLRPGQLKGEILLNLDTEEDDELDIGCAGGVDISAYKTYATAKTEGDAVSISVKGLNGGHSGMDIDKNLGNANVLLARVLYAALSHSVSVVSVDGGGLRNAIPREANAVVRVKSASNFKNDIQELINDIKAEFAVTEKNLSIEINEVNNDDEGLSTTDSEKLIRALTAAHNGVYRMSPDIAGLVETSNNIARVELKNGDLKILNLSRSSVESGKAAVAHQLQSVFELADMKVELSGSYPGWKPTPDASIIRVMEKIYKEKFGETPKVVACHAGLECGIIGANYPEMEMISFGPNIKGAHSPDERVSISSVQKFWSYLKDILAEIPSKN